MLSERAGGASIRDIGQLAGCATSHAEPFSLVIHWVSRILSCGHLSRAARLPDERANQPHHPYWQRHPSRHASWGRCHRRHRRGCRSFPWSNAHARLCGFCHGNRSCAQSTRKAASHLEVFVFPLSAVSLVLFGLLPNTGLVRLDIPTPLFVHIVLALLAYSVLALAALQALYLASFDRLVKSGNRLPADLSLNTIEETLFESIWLGMIALTLGIISGFVFIEGMTLAACYTIRLLPLLRGQLSLCYFGVASKRVGEGARPVNGPFWLRAARHWLFRQ